MSLFAYLHDPQTPCESLLVRLYVYLEFPVNWPLSCILSVLGLTLECSQLLPYLAMTEQSGHMDSAQLCLNKARCMANMIRLCFLCEQQEVTNQCLKQMFNMIHSIHATLISAPSSETSTPALASAPKNTTYHISSLSGSDLSNPAAFWEGVGSLWEIFAPVLHGMQP